MYYVYIYYDNSIELNLDLELLQVNFKPIYVGKGKKDRLLHASKFKKDNIHVEKVFTGLSENQACFIEAFLIQKIGLENLENKISGTKLYLLNELGDNDLYDFIDLLGKI